jgi:hypothetical protein
MANVGVDGDEGLPVHIHEFYAQKYQPSVTRSFKSSSQWSVCLRVRSRPAASL